MFDCLIKYWKNIGSKIEKNSNNDKSDYIHEQDKELIDSNRNKYGIEPYKFHFNLFPEPFNGNLKSPKIVFLFLNPGYNEADKIVKVEITKDVIKAFKQNYSVDDKYPFFWLNSNYDERNKKCTNRADIKTQGNPGAYYWNKLFDQKTGKSFMKGLHGEYEEYSGGKRINPLVNNYGEAREWIAQNVCDIELFPYHSEKFDPKKYHSSLINCASADVARCNVFLEIYKHPEVLFVFMRSVKLWTNGCKEWEDLLNKRDFNVNTNGNVIINPCPRNPSLNPDKDFGGTIYDWLYKHRTQL